MVAEDSRCFGKALFEFDNELSIVAMCRDDDRVLKRRLCLVFFDIVCFPWIVVVYLLDFSRIGLGKNMKKWNLSAKSCLNSKKIDFEGKI